MYGGIYLLPQSHDFSSNSMTLQIGFIRAPRALPKFILKITVVHYLVRSNILGSTHVHLVFTKLIRCESEVMDLDFRPTQFAISGGRRGNRSCVRGSKKWCLERPMLETKLRDIAAGRYRSRCLEKNAGEIAAGWL